MKAQEPIYLYPDGVPGILDTTDRERNEERPDGLLRIAHITQPCIYPYLPDSIDVNTPMVLICPGGGYGIVSLTSEGFNVAEYLQTRGVAAFVLKYRLPDAAVFENKSIVPLQDVQTALLLLRSQAHTWGLAADNVGVMGFSAGGHLAACASVLYKQAVIDAKPEDVRPDFSLLIYPVISFEDGITHQGSRQNLIGPRWDKATKAYYSCEKQVDEHTPPAFLLHAKDDKSVPYRNSALYHEALEKNGVKSKLVYLEKGGHGFGLQPNRADTNHWIDRAFKWMVDMNIVK